MTGIVRRIDELGRVVLPIETRRMLDIDSGTPLEVLLNGETIILRAYRPGCVFCGAMRDLLAHGGRQVCRGCLRALGLELRQADGVAPETEAVAARVAGTGRRPDERAVREWVKCLLAAKAWQVDEGREGGAVDLFARTRTRTGYVKVVVQEGEEPEWPSGRELGWLKAAATRKYATAVVAFVRTQEPAWSVGFWSGHALRQLSA